MRITRSPNTKVTIFSAAVLALFVVGLSPLPKLLAATSASNILSAGPSLSPVQLSIQTSNLTSVSAYDLVAYNSSGSPVASYTGQYPLVTLDLPSGTYLFAATANGPAPTLQPICCLCAQPETATGTESTPAAKTNPGSSAPPNIAFPCYSGNPSAEYGYSLSHVSGPTSITLTTQSPSGIPTANVSVSVSFENGTAVSGAEVSASVVGANLNWGANSSLSMYAQTAADGVAQLVVPAVPLVVTASDSVQVNFTQTQTTVQVNVGGQPVNVTLYYSPNYVYLSASALLIPPQTSLSMVLTAQSQSPVVPYVVGSAATASPDSSQAEPATSQGVSASSGSASTTANEITAIPAIPSYDIGTATSAQRSSGLSGVSLMELGTLAVAGAVAALVGLAISRKR